MKVFISYARSNEHAARRIYAQLLALKVSPWLDCESLLPGQDWESEIRREIRSSDIVVLLLSSESVDRRGYFQKELRFALDVLSTIPDGHIYLIPIRLDSCRIPEPLAAVHYVDMFPDWDRAFSKLFDSLRLQRILQQSRDSTDSKAESESPIVLLVNDEPAPMNAIVDNWRQCGLTVQYAFSVDQAIEMIPVVRPDIVVSDLSHFLDGACLTDRAAFEILEWALQRECGLKLIIACAELTDDRRNTAARLGAVGICNNTSELNRLVTTVTGVSVDITHRYLESEKRMLESAGEKLHSRPNSRWWNIAILERMALLHQLTIQESQVPQEATADTTHANKSVNWSGESGGN